MPTYVLVHGSGSDGWYWHQVVPELRAREHDVIAPDAGSPLPDSTVDPLLTILDQAGTRRHGRVPAATKARKSMGSDEES
jgi:pimeloyl-ACP methyl ester carboxylesterase